MRPRKKLLLYCGDEITESRMRFVLQTRLSADVSLIGEVPFDAAGNLVDAAVVWTDGIGEALGNALAGQRLNVVRVKPGPDEIVALVERVKIAMSRRPGPKRTYIVKRSV